MRTFFILCILLTIQLSAQETPKTWEFNGDLQLRGELDGRDFYNVTFPAYVTTMRTRIGVTRNFTKGVSFFAQFQDSRNWGQSKTTTAYLANVDMHQVYIQFKDIFSSPVSVRAGRFKYSFGNERLFGNSDWGHFGRAYEGLLFSLDFPWKTDILIANIYEEEKYVSNATPGSYAYPAKRDSSSILTAITVAGKMGESHDLSFVAYYESDRRVGTGTDSRTARYTFNVNHEYKMKPFGTHVEAIYQGGKLGTNSVSAYLLSVALNYRIGNSTFTPGIDMLSGTDPAEVNEINTYDGAFGTGHRFYGFMDYFTSIPANTANLGLQDIFLNYELAPENSSFLYTTAFHNFRTAKNDVNNLSAFGQELDLTIRYSFIKGVNLFWGGSVFFPGDLMKANFAKAGNSELDPSFWSYIMVKATL